MNARLPLPQEQKLTITYRLEPGCLGPEGLNHVRKFCQYAEKEVSTLDSDFIHWKIAPRFNKNVNETRYTVNRKELNHDKANQYLNLFGKNLDELEDHLEEKLAELIDDFFGRH